MYDAEAAALCRVEPMSMFIGKPVSQWMAEASERPDPVRLWSSLWFQDEVACLFADTNMGKSIYAVQIAAEVARSRRVLYFDFEMSDKQFQMRYTDTLKGKLHEFPEGFIRLEFSREVNSTNLATIMQHIAMQVEKWQAKVIIIDNLTWICNRSESGDAAGEMMQMLIELKRKLGLSILVLAHTPKRAVTSALTQNSLAGSKKIANFMDSMFAIGIDRTNIPSGRYIKQIKVRSSEMEYGEDSVIKATLAKDGDWLHFRSEGVAEEYKLLMGSAKCEKSEKVIQLYLNGLSQRAISEQLKMSLREVSRFIKSYRQATEGEISEDGDDPDN